MIGVFVFFTYLLKKLGALEIFFWIAVWYAIKEGYIG